MDSETLREPELCHVIGMQFASYRPRKEVFERSRNPSGSCAFVFNEELIRLSSFLRAILKEVLKELEDSFRSRRGLELFSFLRNFSKYPF